MKFKNASADSFANPDNNQLPPKLEMLPGVHGSRWDVTEPIPQPQHTGHALIEGATTSDANKPTQEQLNADYDWTVTDNFITRICQEVTMGCNLPFMLPKTRVPQIVEKIAKYWFTHCEYASEERWFVVRNKDLQGRQNKRVRLPDQILSISDLQILNASSTVSLRKANFLLERLLTSSINFYTSFTNNVSFNYAGPTGIQSTNYSDDLFTSMMEVGTLETILKRTVTFSFNPLTHILNILGDNEGQDMVLLTFTRVPIYSLFEDVEFLNHCVGQTMIELNFVLSTFDFQMPGGVRINASQYQNHGRDLVEAAKKYIEDNQSGDIMMILTQTN